MAAHWTGVFPAVTTQMHRDESIDFDATAQHIEVLIDSGISGLIMLGSLGENQVMDPAEKRKVVELGVKVARGRIPVLCGVAETSVRLAKSYMDDTRDLGVAGYMIMPAMIYKADQREAITYFRTLAAATKLPWMLYNNPVGYPVDITPPLLESLSDVKNCVAVKESSADPRRITEIRNISGDRFALFVGVDDLALETSILGIDGWVAGAGIAFPAENQYFWELTRAGKWDEARKLYRWFQPLLKLDTHIKFVQYLKLLVQETGLGKEWVRAPKLVLEGEERERVLKIIHDGLAKRPKLPAAGKTHEKVGAA
jgi:dihydrodipicolinate synthase/N-acetylneuraminate lyase